MRIRCDVHVHAWKPAEHVSPEFLKMANEVSGRPGCLDADLEHFDDIFASVDRVVVFGGRAIHSGVHCPNQFIHEFTLRDRSRYIPFASLDPVERDFMDDFERCVGDWKFRGVKLLPMYANFDPRDRRLDPLYEACEKRGLPILFHMGTTFVRWAPLRFTEPMLLEEVAERFPDLKMIAAHLGHPWEHQTAVLIRKQPNIYSDISALFYRPWQLFNSLMLMQEYGVMKKLLFGTDYPFTKPGETAERLREIARFGEGTNFPRLKPELIEEIFERDTVKLLGIG